MDEYEYTDVGGDVLCAYTLGNGISIGVARGGKRRSAFIPDIDVPTVVLELLMAAGQENVIVPKSTDGVVVLGGGRMTCGDVVSGPDATPKLLRGWAADYIAIAEYIETKAAREDAEKAEAEAAEKKLQERRDALADSYGWFNWKNLTKPAQKSIDAYIELEDQLAAK